MRRILGLTSIRSDYDLMSGVYRRLAVAPGVDFKLLVSGAHLSRHFGYSVELVRRDGLPILAEVETLLSGDTSVARLKTAAGLLTGALEVIRAYSPDVMIYAGDREDVLVAAMIGAFLEIPTVHFFAGDHASDGHVDNPVRHAVSKLSTAQFVSVREHARRLAHLGETPSRVFVIGSVALDKFVAEPQLDRPSTLAGVGAKAHASRGTPLAIFIFHPIESERAVAPQYVRTAIAALVERGFHVLIGSPNPDPGNAQLVETLKCLAEAPEVTYYGNASRAHFVNLLRHAAILVGNSSAGLLEAASVSLPVINVGERQRGRLCGRNVVFCDGDAASFHDALERVTAPAFREALNSFENPYGDGQSEPRAVALLTTIDFRAMVRKADDPLDVSP